MCGLLQAIFISATKLINSFVHHKEEVKMLKEQSKPKPKPEYEMLVMVQKVLDLKYLDIYWPEILRLSLRVLNDSTQG